MPFSYTPSIVDNLFYGIEKMNFFTLCVKIYNFRMYTAASHPMFDFTAFDGLVTATFPHSVSFVIQQTISIT